MMDIEAKCSHDSRRFMVFKDSYPLPIQAAQNLTAFVFGNCPITNVNDDSYGVITQNSSYDSKVGFKGRRNSNSPINPDTYIFNPFILGLVPKAEWYPQEISLRSIQKTYFTKRSGAARQFDIKLYNALRITLAYPELTWYVGVVWITDNIFKVYVNIFSTFLGQKDGENCLCHKLGFFATHGFEQIARSSQGSLMTNPECGDVDELNVRLYTDTKKRFTKNSEFLAADQAYQQCI